MSGRVATTIAATVIALAGGGGCNKAHEDASTAPAVVVEPPVAAPDSLLAEIAIATPDATWMRVQRGVGGAAGLLPSTLGGIACSASRIDPSFAPEVDGASPAFAVIAGDPGASGEVRWAVALKLADVRGVRARLIEGDVARFRGRDVAGLTLLEPVAAPAKTRGAAPVVALARAGYLVVARDEASLAALAPYATRTMPTRKLAGEAITVDVPGAALAGPLRSAFARAWSEREQEMLASDSAMRAQHAGHPPDFGDPRAILASIDGFVQARLAVLGDLESVHVGIDAGDADVRATMTASPASEAGPAHQAMAKMQTGDLAPVLALPRDSAVVLFARDDAAARAADASAFGQALDAALGTRWSAAEAKRAHGAIDDWAHARGDWTAIAAVWGDAAKGALVDAPVTDADLAARALREAVDTIEKTPAIRAPLAQWLGASDLSTGSLTLASGARATIATLVPTPSSTRGHAPPPPPLALGWTASGGDARVAVGRAIDVTTLLAAPAPGATLGDDAAMRAVLAPLSPVAGAVVVQPGRAPGCGGATGGVALAWGRRATKAEAGAPESMWGAVELSDSAVRCLGASLF